MAQWMATVMAILLITTISDHPLHNQTKVCKAVTRVKVGTHSTLNSTTNSIQLVGHTLLIDPCILHMVQMVNGDTIKEQVLHRILVTKDKLLLGLGLDLTHTIDTWGLASLQFIPLVQATVVHSLLALQVHHSRHHLASHLIRDTHHHQVDHHLSKIITGRSRYTQDKCLRIRVDLHQLLVQLIHTLVHNLVKVCHHLLLSLGDIRILPKISNHTPPTTSSALPCMEVGQIRTTTSIEVSLVVRALVLSLQGLNNGIKAQHVLLHLVNLLQGHLVSGTSSGIHQLLTNLHTSLHNSGVYQIWVILVSVQIQH